jgi:hypothetical protein
MHTHGGWRNEQAQTDTKEHKSSSITFKILRHRASPGDASYKRSRPESMIACGGRDTASE